MKQWKDHASEQRMDNMEPRLKKQRRNGILRLKTWDGQAKNRDIHAFFPVFSKTSRSLDTKCPSLQATVLHEE